MKKGALSSAYNTYNENGELGLFKFREFKEDGFGLRYKMPYRRMALHEAVLYREKWNCGYMATSTDGSTLERKQNRFR